MNKKEIAEKYLAGLEKGDISGLIDLFDADGVVNSPIYGIKKADAFYQELINDTSNSKLHLKGIFEEEDSNNFVLYFTYEWTLKNDQQVKFDVVDVIELNPKNKIQKLTIIYDTVNARKLVDQLKQ